MQCCPCCIKRVNFKCCTYASSISLFSYFIISSLFSLSILRRSMCLYIWALSSSHFFIFVVCYANLKASLSVFNLFSAMLSFSYCRSCATLLSAFDCSLATYEILLSRASTLNSALARARSISEVTVFM